MESVLATACAFPGHRFDTTVVLILGYRFHWWCMLPYGLRLAALFTADQVEEEPATVANRESPATIKARGFNFIAHCDLPLFETEHIINLPRAVLQRAPWPCITSPVSRLITQQTITYNTSMPDNIAPWTI